MSKDSSILVLIWVNATPEKLNKIRNNQMSKQTGH